MLPQIFRKDQTPLTAALPGPLWLSVGNTHISEGFAYEANMAALFVTKGPTIERAGQSLQKLRNRDLGIVEDEELAPLDTPHVARNGLINGERSRDIFLPKATTKLVDTRFERVAVFRRHEALGHADGACAR